MKGRQKERKNEGQRGKKAKVCHSRKSWLNMQWCVKLIAGKALADASASHILYGIRSSTQHGCRKKVKKINNIFFFAIYNSHFELSCSLFAPILLKTSLTRMTSGLEVDPFWLFAVFGETPCPDNCEMRRGLWATLPFLGIWKWQRGKKSAVC